ncbi:MAG: small multi-drug export protein [Planctomycetaceae bacterium]|nr:small multi-drug export protein [Planctomycetaceae bacterium]
MTSPHGEPAAGCHLSRPNAFQTSLEHESESLWQQHRWWAVTTLTLPLLVAGVAVCGAWILGGALLVRRMTVTVLASAIAGRFIIWTGSSQPAHFSSAQLAMLVLVLDLVWAVVVTWHAGVLFRTPWLGRHLQAIAQDGRRLLLRNRWMKRGTLLVVLCFVMLPVSSTGSIGGSLLARLLGLRRGTTFLVVLAGSVAGVTSMLLFARTLAPWFEQHGLVVQYGVVGLLILLGLLVTQRYRALLAESQASRSSPMESEPS